MNKRAIALAILLVAVARSVFAAGDDPASRDRRAAARPRISQGTLQDGNVAPDFSLQDIEGKKTTKLSDLKGKPVVLIFGSCTCPPFVSSMRLSERLYDTYKDRVHFFVVYVREAHPTDGWALQGNQFQVKSPKSIEERRGMAREFASRLKVSIPILVDTGDDHVEKTYASWPNRMYILDAQGRIADKGMAAPNGTSVSAQRAPELLDRLLHGQR